VVTSVYLSGGGLFLMATKLITTGLRFPRAGGYDMPPRAISGFGVLVVRLSPKQP
jgi:hypothetical protein